MTVIDLRPTPENKIHPLDPARFGSEGLRERLVQLLIDGAPAVREAQKDMWRALATVEAELDRQATERAA